MRAPFDNVPVSVAPTATELATVDVRDTRLLSVLVQNLDVSQTVACTIYRRLTAAGAWAPSTLGDLADIPPLSARSVDIDCATNFELRIDAVASGVGASVLVSARPDYGRRG